MIFTQYKWYFYPMLLKSHDSWFALCDSNRIESVPILIQIGRKIAKGLKSCDSKVDSQIIRVNPLNRKLVRFSQKRKKPRRKGQREEEEGKQNIPFVAAFLFFFFPSFLLSTPHCIPLFLFLLSVTACLECILILRVTMDECILILRVSVTECILFLRFPWLISIITCGMPRYFMLL